MLPTCTLKLFFKDNVFPTFDFCSNPIHYYYIKLLSINISISRLFVFLQLSLGLKESMLLNVLPHFYTLLQGSQTTIKNNKV